MSVEEVLGDVWKGNLTRIDFVVWWMQGDATYLTGYGYLLMLLESNWAFRAIRVVKDDGDAGFGDAGLATFVYQILLVCSAHLGRKTRRLKGFLLGNRYGRHLGHVCDTENETDRVEDVGLARAIKA